MLHTCISPWGHCPAQLQASQGGGLQLLEGGSGCSPTVPRDPQLCPFDSLPPPHCSSSLSLTEGNREFSLQDLGAWRSSEF